MEAYQLNEAEQAEAKRIEDAYKEGKALQVRSRTGNGKWSDMREEPVFNWGWYEFRIKDEFPSRKPIRISRTDVRKAADDAADKHLDDWKLCDVTEFIRDKAWDLVGLPVDDQEALDKESEVDDLEHLILTEMYLVLHERSNQ